MDIKLTIGIPTWNRAQVIQDALDSVVSQIEKDSNLKDIVEILISNNASTDNTNEVVAEYQGRYKDIKINYNAQTENIGFDRNVDTLFKKANGNFVWLLSDDDALEDGAIQKVLQIIDDNQGEELGVIFASYNSYDAKLDKIVAGPDKWFENYCISGLFCDSSVLFEKTNGIGISMVSSNIIRRTFWNELVLDRFIGFNIIHVCVYLQLYLKGKAAFVEYSRLVKYRTDNNEGRWTEIKKNPFNLNYSALFVIHNIMDKLDGDIYTYHYRKEIRQLLKGIAYLKTKNAVLDCVAVSKSIIKFNGYRIETFVLLAVLFTPNFILRFAYKLKHAK